MKAHIRIITAADGDEAAPSCCALRPGTLQAIGLRFHWEYEAAGGTVCPDPLIDFGLAFQNMPDLCRRLRSSNKLWHHGSAACPHKACSCVYQLPESATGRAYHRKATNGQVWQHDLLQWLLQLLIHNSCFRLLLKHRKVSTTNSFLLFERVTAL